MEDHLLFLLLVLLDMSLLGKLHHKLRYYCHDLLELQHQNVHL